MIMSTASAGDSPYGRREISQNYLMVRRMIQRLFQGSRSCKDKRDAARTAYRFSTLMMEGRVRATYVG